MINKKEIYVLNDVLVHIVSVPMLTIVLTSISKKFRFCQLKQKRQESKARHIEILNQ